MEPLERELTAAINRLNPAEWQAVAAGGSATVLVNGVWFTLTAQAAEPTPPGPDTLFENPPMTPAEVVEWLRRRGQRKAVLVYETVLAMSREHVAGRLFPPAEVHERLGGPRGPESIDTIKKALGLLAEAGHLHHVPRGGYTTPGRAFWRMHDPGLEPE